MRGRNICSGEVLTAVCIIDGTNAFVWNAPPIFTHHLSSSKVKYGTRIFAFFPSSPQLAGVLS